MKTLKGHEMPDTLLILDFDHICAATVAKKLRAERIKCRILPGDTAYDELLQFNMPGLILAGGVLGELPDNIDPKLLSCDVPLLCVGDTALAMAELLGCELSKKQFLREVVTVSFNPSVLTEDLSESERYISTLRHIELSKDLHSLAMARDQIIGFYDQTRPIFAFSFQLESNDPDGVSILLRFAKDVCLCADGFTEGDFINTSRAMIEESTKGGTALCALTGSLESGVTAMLAHRALGDRLRCVLIDTCFLRENEPEEILYYYRDSLGINITVVDAKDRFCKALEGLSDRQKQYEVIADLYAQILREASQEIDHDVVIRSTSASDLLLKSDLYIMPPLSSEKLVLEPLHELFKEEIRNVGQSLNMPQELYLAQPFPGTGLALRVMGEITRQKLAILRKADAIFREEIKKANLQKKLWKYFATLRQLNDARDEMDLSVSLRAITLTTLTGEVRVMPARLPYDLLEQYTVRILQALPEVKQIVNDITPGRSQPE